MKFVASLRPSRGASPRLTREVMSNSKDCGAPIDRVRCANWAASRRPAYAAILKPRPQLTAQSPRAISRPRAEGRARNPACGEGPLRLVRYPAVGGEPGTHVQPAARSTKHLRRRAPHPQEADGLRARVLMDEGWVEFNAAARAR